MESSGNAEPQEADKVAVLLRIPLSLKKRLAAYARARGLTLNAAAIVLLDQARSKDEDGPGSLSSRPGASSRASGAARSAASSSRICAASASISATRASWRARRDSGSGTPSTPGIRSLLATGAVE